MTEPTEKEMSCENCRWWDSSMQLSSAQIDTTGACRVQPPKLHKFTGEGVWPFTNDIDWCGGFEKQTGDE
jgi:hypothetical protein